MCGLPSWTWTQMAQNMVRKSFSSRCWKCKTQNKVFSFPLHWMKVLRRIARWRLGQACWSCHLSSTGEKWLSPMLTLALVVPCWWDQLTNLVVSILLESCAGNEEGAPNKTKMSPFFLKMK